MEDIDSLFGDARSTQLFAIATTASVSTLRTSAVNLQLLVSKTTGRGSSQEMAVERAVALPLRTIGSDTSPNTRRGRPRDPATDGRILDAALEMLSAAGYDRLRLDDLAGRAGVAKTTILRRWPSKAVVAAAAIERLALQTGDLPESGTLRDDLRALVASAVAAFTRGRGRFVPSLMRESGHHPEITELLLTMIHTRRLAYRRVLARALARGELDPDVDQDLMIDLLMGPVWTRLLITQVPIPPTLADEIVDAVLRAYPPPPALAT